MEIFISLYARRSLFTHFVLICVRFVSNFNSKSESHLVSFSIWFFFFFLFTLEGLLLVCGSGTMHDTNGEKKISLSKYQRSAVKKSVAPHRKLCTSFCSFFSLRSLVHSCAICRCNVMKFGSVLRSINFYYDIHCLFSIRFSWCWLLGSMIKLCRIDFSKLMYRYAHLKFIPCSVRFGIRFD